MKKEKKWHFAVYSHNLVIKESKLVTRKLIVLVSPDGEKIVYRFFIEILAKLKNGHQT